MTTDTPSAFASRLAQATRAAGLSDRRLAALAGVHRSAVGHYRTGRTAGCTSETAIRLCSVLGCDLRWLLTGVGRCPTKRVARAAVERAERAALSPLPGEVCPSPTLPAEEAARG